MSMLSRRLGGRAAVVAGVALAGPVVFAGAALACSSPPSSPCLTGTAAIKVDSFSASSGTAVVELAKGACSGQVVTLAAYELQGTSQFPQTLVSESTRVLWAPGWPTTIWVHVPPCSSQVDLVSGWDVPKTLTQAYFTPAGTLLAAGAAGSGVCTPTPCHK